MNKVIDIQDGIKDLIDKNRETYKINLSRIISDFRGEKQTTNDYRGRQLLELLQNADDARTNKTHIHLDTKNQLLRIANNGDKFDLNGIQSLLIANLSSKHKKEFIGNKGLGFRSILNWTSKINIITREFKLTFSPEIAQQRFYEFIPDLREREKIIHQNNKYLSKNEVPFAILALPEHNKGEENQQWETIIELKYHKKYEGEILEQLEAISPRILLFLNHTDEIEISGTGSLDTRIKRHFLNDDKTEIQINDNQWHVYNSGEVLYPDSDDKYYQFKIAWQDDLSDEDSTFFTYFPTEVDTQLPFLIHATFELNQSRNDLLKGDENQFLLSEIAKAIGEIAVTRIRNNESSDWRAFQFLEPLNYNNNSKLDSFFAKLSELQNELEIYPCVDNTYCVLEEAVFYTDEFSDWVIHNNVAEFFEDLLISVDDNELPDETFRYYSDEGWLEIISKVTHEIIDLHERALLIKILTGRSFHEIHNSKVNLPLLLDTKNNIIIESIQAFILSKTDIEQYRIPKYVDISFMSGELYEELLTVLEDEISYKWNGQEHKSRPLKRIIVDVVNIGSNDITDVIRNIVMTSDREMKVSEGETRNNIAIELVESLFSIYQLNPDRRNRINLNVPLLNKNLDLCPATDLYLGEDFELGEPTSIIFKDIFEDKDYIAGNEFWELEEGGYAYLENFFEWLGVNRLTKTNSKPKYLRRDQSDGYTDFVFSNTSWPENNSHKDYTVLEISDFKKISSHINFSLEALIAWLITDSRLFNQLDFYNEDSFSYSYHNKVTPVNKKPSFIYYQIKEHYLKNLDSKFITELNFAKELGYSSIDFEHRIFRDLDISEDEIYSVLNQLNISLSFNDLEPEEVYGLMSELSKKDPEGKYARKIYYELAFNYFRTNKDIAYSDFTPEYKLLAKRKNKKSYISVSEVYYSDNSTLPSKIAEDFWMLDFPKRAGESQVSKYFGVKTFKDVQIRIENDSIKISHVSQEFQSWLDKIKPYLLTYRLQSIKSSIEKTEADELKKVEISIVSSLTYSIKKGEEKHLFPGEFLPKTNGKDYYLCVKQNTTLENIKNTPNVCEAFAEIMCMLFKVNDHKDDYRAVFKDRNNLIDTQYLINVKSLEEYYKKALELLGISTEEFNFWSKVYNYKGLTLKNSIKETDELYRAIQTDLGIDILRHIKNLDYENLDSIESAKMLKEIIRKLDIPLNVIFDTNSSGIFNYHKHNIETEILDNEKLFDSCLWKNLKSNPDQQKNLIPLQRKYELLVDSKKIENNLYNNRFTFKVDYFNLLKDTVHTEFDVVLAPGNEYTITRFLEYDEILEEIQLAENDIEDEKIRSLLYFQGNENKLRGLLKVEEEGEDTEVGSSAEKPTGEIIFSNTEKVIPKSNKKSKGKNSGWSHGNKDVKRNNRAGKSAEEYVYYTLLASENVQEVKWVSGFSNTSDRSDTKHYDIRYKTVGSDSWKYLEVKSFNGSYFHLSKSEKEEAIRRGKDYEIALVFQEEIHILKDYFIKEIEFENNDKYYATPADYIITLKITKEK
ncbi:MAG: DUF3883 domain-containing protein [Acidimicrobiia bacterium]|nr:DUF3883 domain-containing protein [Acidimicrobiia bacterium]